MRIAIVLNTSWNIFHFRKGLIESLQKEGHQIICIAPEDNYSKFLVEDLNCEYIPIKLDNKGSNPFKDFFYAYGLYQIYSFVKPDMILHFTIKPNIYGTLAAKLLGIPVINNVCGLGTVFLHPSFSSWIARKLYRFSFKFVHKVFFQNPDDLALFVEKKYIQLDKSALLPGSGIPLNEFMSIPFNRNQDFTFLMIARMLYDKGVIEYVEAAKILKQKGHKIKVQLLGSYDDSDHLSIKSKDIFQWVEAGLIEYLGKTDDVRKFISEADVVVLPSYREGTPRALLEAAAMAKPLITTNVAGCRQVVEHGDNGFLCEAKDIKGLSDQMIKMMQLSDALLRAMGLKSREIVEEKFDEKLVIHQYLDVIDHLGLQKNERQIVPLA
jgi:glycosyltransferase involved in cell wall biosynthesis